ncbi:hypothetical protein GCM10022384_41140 [Streptomyces marokkonensis]|uniref:Uncharacterized protein n=1 Tax=Streptomyces marokkonensis TaxID=324855 RepID=A0ABP7QWD1_9ACTN
MPGRTDLPDALRRTVISLPAMVPAPSALLRPGMGGCRAPGCTAAWFRLSGRTNLVVMRLP